MKENERQDLWSVTHAPFGRVSFWKKRPGDEITPDLARLRWFMLTLNGRRGQKRNIKDLPLRWGEGRTEADV